MLTTLSHGVAGKSFTMEGAREPPSLAGIIPRSFAHIFGHIAESTNERTQVGLFRECARQMRAMRLADEVDVYVLLALLCMLQYLVRASYLELYNEGIHDLLSGSRAHRGTAARFRSLELRENKESGVFVKDLTSKVGGGAAGSAHRVVVFTYTAFRMSGSQVCCGTGRSEACRRAVSKHGRHQHERALFSVACHFHCDGGNGDHRQERQASSAGWLTEHGGLGWK